MSRAAGGWQDAGHTLGRFHADVATVRRRPTVGADRRRRTRAHLAVPERDRSGGVEGAAGAAAVGADGASGARRGRHVRPGDRLGRGAVQGRGAAGAGRGTVRRRRASDGATAGRDRARRRTAGRPARAAFLRPAGRVRTATGGCAGASGDRRLCGRGRRVEAQHRAAASVVEPPHAGARHVPRPERRAAQPVPALLLVLPAVAPDVPARVRVDLPFDHRGVRPGGRRHQGDLGAAVLGLRPCRHPDAAAGLPRTTAERPGQPPVRGGTRPGRQHAGALSGRPASPAGRVGARADLGGRLVLRRPLFGPVRPVVRGHRDRVQPRRCAERDPRSAGDHAARFGARVRRRSARQDERLQPGGRRSDLLVAPRQPRPALGGVAAFHGVGAGSDGEPVRRPQLRIPGRRRAARRVHLWQRAECGRAGLRLRRRLDPGIGRSRRTDGRSHPRTGPSA